MSKQARGKAAPIDPPAAPDGALPRPVSLLGAGLAAVAALLLIGLFVRALPDAAQRAKAGVHRAAEGACEALRPDPGNATLGALPVAAPDFALKDHAGRTVKLSDLRGSVVLINFWATWCTTCVVEMPSMERLVSRMAGRPFRLLAVSVDEGWEPVRKFFAQGSPLEVLMDSERTVPKLYGTDKFPESFLVDKDGTLRYYVVSNRDWSTPDVASCVEAMLD